MRRGTGSRSPRTRGRGAARTAPGALAVPVCLSVALLLPIGAHAQEEPRPASPTPAGNPPPVRVPIESGSLQNIAAERHAVDLPTVLRLALERNLSIARARESIREQEAVRRGVQAQALPNLGVSAGLARLLPNISTVAGVPAGRATLFISPGRVYYDARSARFAVRSSEFNREAVTQDVLLEATARYSNLELTEGLVRVAEQSVTQARELLRLTEERQKGGLALTADVLRAQARLGEEQQALVEAQKDFKVASITLATLLRLPPAVTLVTSEPNVQERTLVSPEVPQEQLVGQALRQRPELGQAGAELRAARMRRKSALWGALIPTLGVEQWFGGVTTDTPQSDRRIWYYLEWRLLDNLGQSARSKSDQAKSQERQARLRQDELQEQIVGEVLAAQQAVAAAKEQVRVAGQQVTAAEGAVTVFRERYLNGLGLQLDVLAGQQALTAARQNLVRAVVRFNLAQAELQTRLGVRLRME